jgi:hypothetical protein
MIFPGVEQLEAIQVDYQMRDKMFVLDMQVPLVGYVPRSWAVNCPHNHRLDPKQHHVYLKNPQTLSGVESTALELGYSVGRSDL